MCRSKLKKLKAGSKVAIFAPGSPTNPELLSKGIEALRQRGFEVMCSENPSASYVSYEHGFCSQSAARRAQVLMEAIEDETVDAVLAARGGYGTQHILDLIDYQKIAQARKPIVGYSDVTALLAAVNFKTGLPTIHGATVATEFSSADLCANSSVESLLSLVSDENYRLRSRLEVLRRGAGEGRIIAGNLTMLITLLGTPYDGSYDGAILVLEEVSEAPYRVHRMLTHLRQAGKLSKLSGLVFGRFSASKSNYGPGIDEVLASSVGEMLAESHFPVLKGFDFGHLGTNYALPLGCRARIVDETFELLESPL